MKTAAKKQTYIEKKKKEYASNQAYIQKVVNLTDQVYHETQFETGCLFLEDLFPRTTSWGNYYELHAYNKGFWAWWKAEWKKWEQEFIQYLKDSQVEMTKQLWQQEMQQMLLDGYVESSFHHNYRKLIQQHLESIK